MNALITNNRKAKVAIYKGGLSISELNAVLLGEAPNKLSKCEELFGAGTFAVSTRLKYIRTIDKIITPVNCEYGAPMGRANIGQPPISIINGTLKTIKQKRPNPNYYMKVYDCKVPMGADGAYDKGGAYWGIPPVGQKALRVKYTKDLSYIEFYWPA